MNPVFDSSGGDRLNKKDVTTVNSNLSVNLIKVISITLLSQERIYNFSKYGKQEQLQN